MPNPALPADDRPIDPTPVSTAQLPDTPIRDRNIPASAWDEAPSYLLESGADLPGRPTAMYKRRIGEWFLWRAGPAKGDARYVAVHRFDQDRHHEFRLHRDGTGVGIGPSGARCERLREFKVDLLASSS